MKTNLTSLTMLSLLISSIGLTAGEPANAKQASPEFDRLKALAGTWKGRTDIGQGPVDIVAEYRLIAGGTVLEERVFPGTPNEMVTMFYDKNGQLALTHYCLMGNRPAMVLKSSDARTLRFDFDESCGIKATVESHMHAVTLHFDDADTITTTCRAIVNGKALEEHPTTLKRVKS